MNTATITPYGNPCQLATRYHFLVDYGCILVVYQKHDDNTLHVCVKSATAAIQEYATTFTEWLYSDVIEAAPYKRFGTCYVYTENNPAPVSVAPVASVLGYWHYCDTQDNTQANYLLNMLDLDAYVNQRVAVAADAIFRKLLAISEGQVDCSTQVTHEIH